MDYNLCTNMYLEQENISIFGSFFPQIIFYSVFTYYIFSFINNYNTESPYKVIRAPNQRTTQESFLYNYLKDSFLEYNDDKNEIQKKQEILDKMLSTKTLERSFILYYIFKIKGDYQVKVDCNCNDANGGNGCNNCNGCNDCIEEYNTFLEYKSLEDICKQNESIVPNLDETLEPDIEIKIGEKEYNINTSHLVFISWIYHSGIYEYLTKNEEIKFEVLKEMNDAKLLAGNVFLRYQMQLLEKAAPKQDLVNPVRKRERDIRPSVLQDLENFEYKGGSSRRLCLGQSRAYAMEPLVPSLDDDVDDENDEYDNTDSLNKLLNYFETHCGEKYKERFSESLNFKNKVLGRGSF